LNHKTANISPLEELAIPFHTEKEPAKKQNKTITLDIPGICSTYDKSLMISLMISMIMISFWRENVAERVSEFLLFWRENNIIAFVNFNYIVRFSTKMSR